MWCIAELDEAYIQRMEDVLALYEKPWNPREPVLCVDEKPVSLHAEVRPPRPARPGHVAKRDNEYRRCGMANIFGTVEPKAGRHFTQATPDRSAFQFAHHLRKVIAAYPQARKIHVVADNLNIHGRKSFTDHLGERRGRALWNRLQMHYTPKHGSWLNQAELELSLWSRQCLGRRRIPNLAVLKRETRAWKRRTNRQRVRIQWRFDRKTARKKFGYIRNLFMRSKT